jgi:biotin carboxylase
MSTTGAGESCLDYCRDQGYQATLLAEEPERYAGRTAPGVRVLQCPTSDGAALVDTVAALDARAPVNAVTTTQDLFVPQAALVATELGLPGMSYEAAVGVRNKHRMRRTLARHCPHLNPPFRLAFTPDEARAAAEECGYPVVAKPVDANDSWRVRRLDDAEALDAYLHEPTEAADRMFPALSPGTLIEGFVDGTDYSVETAHYRGRDPQLLAVSQRVLAGEDQGRFAELGDLLPVEGPLADRLFREVATALRHLGVDCGVIHTECRVRGDQVTILEVNPRLAGNRLGSQMIEIAYGVSAVAQVVATALDEEIPWQPVRRRGAGGYCVPMPRTGVFCGVSNLAELAALPGVVYAGLTTEVGGFHHAPPRSNLDLVARILTEAATPTEALLLAERAAARAEVVVDDR